MTYEWYNLNKNFKHHYYNFYDKSDNIFDKACMVIVRMLSVEDRSIDFFPCF